MEKLLIEYFSKYNIASKLLAGIYTIGFICIVLFFTILSFSTNNIYLNFFEFIVCAFILEQLCEIKSLINIVKKFNMKYSIREIICSFKKRVQIYEEVDSRQKEWIINFCNKNKINNITKINILREEVRKNDKPVKYIDPIIISSLTIVIWEKAVNKMFDDFGYLKEIFMFIFLIFVISFIIGMLKKIWQEYLDDINKFIKYSGYNRLNELLIYAILKCEDNN